MMTFKSFAPCWITVSGCFSAANIGACFLLLLLLLSWESELSQKDIHVFAQQSQFCVKYVFLIFWIKLQTEGLRGWKGLSLVSLVNFCTFKNPGMRFHNLLSFREISESWNSPRNWIYKCSNICTQKNDKFRHFPQIFWNIYIYFCQSKILNLQTLLNAWFY